MSTATQAGNLQTHDRFRDHLPTSDARGKRIWVFARQPDGRFYVRRAWVAAFLLVLMFAGPFIRINDNPLLLFDIVHRRFSIFGQMFWPTDTFIFALCMVIFFVMIALFTAVFGRVWCGWLCPQTVLMEMVFRRIEYLVDGDFLAQKRLAAAPWTTAKLARRIVKHAVFFAISFVIGNWLLMYIIGYEALWQIVTGNPADHLRGLGAMLGFTAVFYLIFARFREQACTYICPYGRFQTVLLDDNSLIVSYDPRRGERRSRFSKAQPRDARRAQGLGDCIDCGACVDVCPTGIDIRNGLQMECVHCTACIDACDYVMDKLEFPRGLIRYASQSGINEGRPFRFEPRMALYCAILLLLGGLLSFLLLSRTDIQATALLRTPGQLYTTLPGGSVQNVFLTKIRNKTHAPQPVRAVRSARSDPAGRHPGRAAALRPRRGSARRGGGPVPGRSDDPETHERIRGPACRRKRRDREGFLTCIASGRSD
jgi:cytochrome c oxidase accessory protein FixG